MANVVLNSESHTTATVDSFDDDGFTLNYTAGSGITQGWYLAFADAAVNKKIVTLGGS